MKESELIKNLKKEGFRNIFIYGDTKGTYYSWHKHLYKEVRVMLKGKMKINTKDKSYILKAGDRLDIEPGEVHEAYVLEDSEYICGSK